MDHFKKAQVDAKCVLDIVGWTETEAQALCFARNLRSTSFAKRTYIAALPELISGFFRMRRPAFDTFVCYTSVNFW